MAKNKDDKNVQKFDFEQARKDDTAIEKARKGWKVDNEELDDIVRIKEIVDGDEELW